VEVHRDDRGVDPEIPADLKHDPEGMRRNLDPQNLRIELDRLNLEPEVQVGDPSRHYPRLRLISTVLFSG